MPIDLTDKILAPHVYLDCTVQNTKSKSLKYLKPNSIIIQWSKYYSILFPNAFITLRKIMVQEYCLLCRLWLMMVIHDKLTVKRKLKVKIILEFEESQMFKKREDRRERKLKQKGIKKIKKKKSNSWEYKQKKLTKKIHQTPNSWNQLKKIPSKPENSSELFLTSSFFSDFEMLHKLSAP